MLLRLLQHAAIIQREPTTGEVAKAGLKSLGSSPHWESPEYADRIPDRNHRSSPALNPTRRTFEMRRAIVLMFFIFSVPSILSAQQPLEMKLPITQAPVANLAETSLNWESPARLHHAFGGKTGRLTLSQDGVEFRPSNGSLLRWAFVEIKTFDLLNPRRLVITGYENRTWHRHGDREFRLDLSTPMPPRVAAELAAHVGKPVRNGEPNPTTPSFAIIPARHRTLRGGTNGTLRLGADGIEYVTTTGKGGRSWRWSDIDTLANPDPYHLTLTGYRETFDFELKEPISRMVFVRLWDQLYARDFKTPALAGEAPNP